MPKELELKKMRKFYNKEIKEHFLLTYDDLETKEFYGRILERIGKKEKKIKKDLYNFTYDEIISTLRSFNYKSRDTLNGVLSIIVRYIDFAIEYNYKPRGEINIAKYNISSEDLNNLVDIRSKNLRYIYSKDEFKEIVYKCANAQDAVIYALLFEGLRGEDFMELRGLKKSDVNRFDNTITIKRDFNIKDDEDNWHKEEKEIKIQVSDFTMEVIQEAIDQDDYLSVNLGSGTGKSKYESRPLSSTDYVLRVSGTNKPNEPVSKPVINRRVKQIAKIIDKKTITPTTIGFSGAAIYAQELAEKDNLLEPTTEIFKKACTRYGLHPANSWYRLKRIWKFIYNKK